jgi:hypothetical protein
LILAFAITAEKIKNILKVLDFRLVVGPDILYNKEIATYIVFMEKHEMLEISEHLMCINIVGFLVP